MEYSENEFKEYFLNHIEELDPIEGIWSLSVIQKKTANGIFRGEVPIENFTQVAVYKLDEFDDKFAMSYYSNDNAPFIINFTKTAINNTYTCLYLNTSTNSKRGVNVTLTNGAMIEFEFYLYRNEIRDHYIQLQKQNQLEKLPKKYFNEVVNNTQILEKHKWIKMFPTEKEYNLAKNHVLPEKKINLENNRITALYNSATEELDKGNFQAALDNLDKFIEIDPNYPNAYLLRGYINSTYLRNFNLAINDFTYCIQMNQEDELAYYYRGMAYYKKNKKIEAIKDYTKTISIDKDNTNAYFMRGLIKSEFNDLNGAIADYDEIIKREKTAIPYIYKMSTVYNNKAYCLVRLGKFNEGLPLVNKALQMDESEAYIWDTRGEIYYRIGLYDNCINDMSRAINIDQEAGNSYYFRGLAKIKLGLKSEGCKDLTKAGEQGMSEAYIAISENCN